MSESRQNIEFPPLINRTETKNKKYCSLSSYLPLLPILEPPSLFYS